MAAIQGGAVARLDREREQAKGLVYAQAQLNRAAYHAKRFPKFEEAFRAPVKRRQSAEEILAVMQQWDAVLRQSKE